jgi:hypothetical protein
MTTAFITAQNEDGQASEGDLTNPITANSPFVPVDKDSEPVDFSFDLVTTDEDAKHDGDYTIELVSTANGNHILNFRLSEDGENFNDWGDSLTLSNVSISKNTPVKVYGQFRALPSDMTGNIICGLRLPQTGITWNQFKIGDIKSGARIRGSKDGDIFGKSYIAVSNSGNANSGAKIVVFTLGSATGGARIVASSQQDANMGAIIYAALKGSANGQSQIIAGLNGIINGGASIDGFPAFSDAFSSLDTNRFGYNLAGNMAQNVTEGEWAFTGAAAITDAFVYYLKQNYVWGSNHSIKVKAAIRTGTNQGAIPVIGVYQKATAPAVGSMGTALFWFGGYTYNTNFYFFAIYYAQAGGYYCWVNDSWDLNSYTQCTEITGITDNTNLTYIMEYSATAGVGSTPAIRFLLKNAAESTTYFTTDWVTYSDLKTSTNPKWVIGGKGYTNAHVLNFDMDSIEVY